MADRPSGSLVAAAMRRALALRRERHARDPRFAAFSPAALQEQVTGAVVPARPGRGGWWRVGTILDDLAEGECEVWIEPRRRRLRLLWRPARPPEETAPPRPDGRYFDGFRRRWVDPGAAPAPNDESVSPGPA